MTTIHFPVTIRKTAAGRFRAESAHLAAEGDTEEEAVGNLQAEALQPLAVKGGPNPWVALAGAFKDDPLVDEWLKVMAELREVEGPIPELS